MSVILGLHFGHDASVAVLVDGFLAAYVQRERICRIKHAFSLDRLTLDTALSRAGVTVREIDVVAVTSTQGCEPILAKLEGCELFYDATMSVGHPASLVTSLGSDPLAVERACAPSMIQRVLGTPPDPGTHPAFKTYYAEFGQIPMDRLRRFPWLEAHANVSGWQSPSGLNAIACVDVEAKMNDERCEFGFHYPLKVSIDGRDLPGVKVDHHLAHAASSYFRAGTKRALILTNDGYGGRRTPFSNGGVYLGLENRLIALSPHFLTHGYLYDYVARSLGLSAIGASGKLMGLAPYGAAEYFDDRFVGDSADHSRSGIDGSPIGWIKFANSRSRQLGHNQSNHASPDLPFSTFQINLPASTQLLFEETWIALVNAATQMLLNHNINVDSLCLSGGAALNCPSNSRIYEQCSPSRMFIEPNCDDSGLAIGSALWVYHALLDNPQIQLRPFSIAETYTTGYSKNDVAVTIENFDFAVFGEAVSEPAFWAAKDLADGLIIAWFEGGSEMGPRALGHRSILADPRTTSIRDRVNEIKWREKWRPLAPAVLESQTSKHFDFSRMPESSPFMLFTAKVLNPSLRGVTHIDNSARAQTVNEDNGTFNDLLEAFFALTGVPVLLNTSMNLKGEPIVESPADAINFFLKAHVDVLYMDGHRIIRR